MRELRRDVRAEVDEETRKQVEKKRLREAQRREEGED